MFVGVGDTSSGSISPIPVMDAVSATASFTEFTLDENPDYHTISSFDIGILNDIDITTFTQFEPYSSVSNFSTADTIKDPTVVYVQETGTLYDYDWKDLTVYKPYSATANYQTINTINNGLVVVSSISSGKIDGKFNSQFASFDLKEETQTVVSSAPKQVWF